MVSDEIGTLLHDRATRGKTLTPEEHNVLEQWYREQDRAEAEALNFNADLKTEHGLQEQIDAILVRIGTVSEQIYKLTDENRSLKNDIAHLHRK